MLIYASEEVAVRLGDDFKGMLTPFDLATSSIKVAKRSIIIDA